MQRTSACTRVLQTFRPRVDRSVKVNFQPCRKLLLRFALSKIYLEVDYYY